MASGAAVEVSGPAISGPLGSHRAAPERLMPCFEANPPGLEMFPRLLCHACFPSGGQRGALSG